MLAVTETTPLKIQYDKNDVTRLKEFLDWFDLDVRSYKPGCREKTGMALGIIIGATGASFTGKLAYNFGVRILNPGFGIFLGLAAAIPLMSLNAKHCKILGQNIARGESTESKSLRSHRVCGPRVRDNLATVVALIPGTAMAITLGYIALSEFSQIAAPLGYVIAVPTASSALGLYAWAIKNLGGLISGGIQRCYLNYLQRRERYTANVKRKILIDHINKAMMKIGQLGQDNVEDIRNKLFEDDGELIGRNYQLLLENLMLLLGNDKHIEKKSACNATNVFKGIGTVVGFVAAYVILPAGQLAGKALGEYCGADPVTSEMVGNVIGWVAGFGGGCLMSHASSQSLSKLYSMLRGAYVNRGKRTCDRYLIPQVLLQLLFISISAVSVIPRIELTLADSNLPMPLTIAVLASVFIAGFCKDYWGIDGFYDEVFNSNPQLVMTKMLTAIKTKVSDISDEHVDALLNHVVDKSEQVLEIPHINDQYKLQAKSRFFQSASSSNETERRYQFIESNGIN